MGLLKTFTETVAKPPPYSKFTLAYGTSTRTYTTLQILALERSTLNSFKLNFTFISLIGAKVL